MRKAFPLLTFIFSIMISGNLIASELQHSVNECPSEWNVDAVDSAKPFSALERLVDSCSGDRILTEKFADGYAEFDASFANYRVLLIDQDNEYEYQYIVRQEGELLSVDENGTKQYEHFRMISNNKYLPDSTAPLGSYSFWSANIERNGFVYDIQLLDTPSKDFQFFVGRIDDFETGTVECEYRYSDTEQPGTGECTIEGQAYHLTESFEEVINAIDKHDNTLDYGIIYEQKIVAFLNHHYES